ncbi:EI24 domain-containing protein [Streptomyces sp. HNM0574]|uniref:EI24 domain-containing protein n=1 Tax=Streptomyces sp. HNM0574 TaxID=2714954 RepID=UPI00146A4AB8|nr:EI24 domain-containing protein [Streptomyces sp. HNM0574]NLU67482.1 hypothetical protein [Streptomyces sp. HNM0574]
MRDVRAGARYLGRGQRWVMGHGRWFGFGLLPALITFVLYAAGLAAFAFATDDIVTWATPFADDWAWRAPLRTLFAVLLWLAVLGIALLTFTAVTLLVGDPFYEKLSEETEKSYGGCPEGPDRSLAAELWIALCDSLYVLWRAALFAVPLFFLGFLPVVGQTVVPALGFCVSGFFLAVELCSVAMQRRDIPVRERLRLLGRRKGLAIGFGLPLVLCFLVPFVAVLLMPGAVAGAALLVRDVLGEDTEPREDGAQDASQPQAAQGDLGTQQGPWAPQTPWGQQGPTGPGGAVDPRGAWSSAEGKPGH